ncbi:MAG: radical SAM/SPASM domain-containing protein [Bacteroidales bacterium]|nr:radical SAM/SPASM domain-containing protein [Bacteroidales bacterium]MDY0141463.1 radical SAM/SPASM domain-containing protein [Bacteroidales bacterium]
MINFINLSCYYRKVKTKYSKQQKRSKTNKFLPPPSFISFEPTNYCNLKCPACPSGTGLLTRDKGFADLGLFKKLIRENKNHLINIILHFQGEPLLHEQIGEMISFARTHKIYTEFSTNGHTIHNNIDIIKKAKPDKIVVSLDGIEQETYNKYRINGDIQKVYQGLEALSELNKKERPYIELQFLVFKHNEHEIKHLHKLKKKYKIDKISLKTAQIYSENQIALLPKNYKYSRYIVNGAKFTIKSKLPNSCKRIIFGSVITWDGKLVPCCFDKDADFIMGDVKNKTINNIRNENNYQRFIKNVFSQRNKIEMCKNCTEGIKI